MNAAFPDNPVLVRAWRGGAVESQHRGAWVLVDSSGAVLESAGAVDFPVYARSVIKSLQALPLLESGAAERFGITDEELALCIASHNAEPLHRSVVLGLLERLGLGEDALACGPQLPGDPDARRAHDAAGGPARAVDNNCSGKHAGFLALALHLGVDPRDYLKQSSASQQAVRRVVGELTGLNPAELEIGVDGCSAPTFRLPLVGIATAFARLSNPAGLTPERRRHARRLTDAAARYPAHIAGNHERIDTDLVRISGGRLFPKIGAEAVYAVGLVGGDRALALKLDDGDRRGLHALLTELLDAHGFLASGERDALERWMQRATFNRAGLEVGRIEVGGTEVLV